MINSVVIMGRLTQNPEYRKDKNFTRFTVAVDRAYKENTTDFIPCIVFGKTAEFVHNYFSKGQMIAIDGELHTDKYTNSKGETRTSYTVVANQVSFCGGKNEGKKAESVVEAEPVFDVPVDEDDLPF